MAKWTPFPYKAFVILFFFSVAMAFAESAIVVYLREIYYPAGFSFPLKEIPMHILAVEIIREAATIIMLGTVGWFSGTSAITRFAGFMIGFGIWDIFYYIFLKLTLNWPAHWMEWDILFLIPIPWVGPVMAPILVSLGLIVAGMIIWWFQANNLNFKITLWEWIVEIIAGLIILISFLTNTEVLAQQKIPQTFSWPLFLTGFMMGILVFYLAIKRNLQQIKMKEK